MADDRWAWQYSDGSFTTSGSMGTWEVASRFDLSQLPASSAKRMVVFVRGIICEFSNAGVQPTIGVASIGLDVDTGSQPSLTTHQMHLPLARALTAYPASNVGNGHPFAFSFAITSTVTDPQFGSGIATNSGGNLAIWARADWNGAPLAHATTFRLRDIQWLVLDADVLEAEGMLLVDEGSAVNLDNTAVGGVSGKLLAGRATPLPQGNWMQIAACVTEPNYDPGQLGTAERPFISAGRNATAHTDAVFANQTPTAEMGVALPHGPLLLQPPSASKQGRHAMASIGLCTVPASGTHYGQIIARDPLSYPLLQRTDVIRSLLVHVNLDASGVEHFTRNSTVTATQSGVVSSNITPTFYPLPLNNNTSTGFSTQPIIVMTSDVQRNGSAITRSIQCRMRNATGGFVRFPSGQHVLFDNERFPHANLFTDKNIPGQPRTYSLDAFDRLGTATPADARLPHLFMFHSTLNVTDVLTPPYSDVTPVQLTITAEGPLIGTMSALPFAPNREQQVSVDAMRHGEIKGGTGYRRTWPTWVHPRRIYNLQWRLADSDAQTLVAFLKANDYFAYTPPNGIATPVVVSSDVETLRESDGSSTVSVQAMQLLYTQ